MLNSPNLSNVAKFIGHEELYVTLFLLSLCFATNEYNCLKIHSCFLRGCSSIGITSRLCKRSENLIISRCWKPCSLWMEQMLWLMLMVFFGPICFSILSYILRWSLNNSTLSFLAVCNHYVCFFLYIIISCLQILATLLFPVAKLLTYFMIRKIAFSCVINCSAAEHHLFLHSFYSYMELNVIWKYFVNMVLGNWREWFSLSCITHMLSLQTFGLLELPRNP